MKFFNNFFSTIRSRSYIKFSQNLFFIRHMLSLELQHTLVPHIFLPFKSLKIKFFKNVKIQSGFYAMCVMSLFTLFVSFIYFLI